MAELAACISAAINADMVIIMTMFMTMMVMLMTMFMMIMMMMVVVMMMKVDTCITGAANKVDKARL